MLPPIFKLLNTAEIREFVGKTGRPRIFDFGIADQNVVAPYIVCQHITNSPFNSVSNAPDADLDTVQVDIYTNTPQELRELSRLVRKVFDEQLIINKVVGQEREEETKLYRLAFEVYLFSKNGD